MNNLQELVCIINSSLVISMPYTVYTTRASYYLIFWI